ncbi:hypothetical protein Ddye_026078 [Dipteronia dyeriana]|uniref:RNase H type-1 domain-containing protein n=1 Tax=Dipteronia dyeriana TaxID=168575 RepID=A0AAD9WQ53_9ROSI|nr:hypothetical protein Ddye_026078 [Dipteronia dyeriana]
MANRNHQGHIMAANVQRIEARFPPQVAEHVVVLHGINLAVDTGMIPSVVESKALGVVKMINEGCPSPANIGLVIGDVLTCLQALMNCSVMYVSRKANFIAHTLSTIALRINEDQFWIEDYSLCVERFHLDKYPVL